MSDHIQRRTISTHRTTAVVVACTAVTLPGCSATPLNLTGAGDRTQPQVVTFNKYASSPDKSLTYQSNQPGLSYSHVNVVYQLSAGSGAPTQDFHMLVGLEAPGSTTIKLVKHSFVPVPQPIESGGSPAPLPPSGGAAPASDPDLNGPALTVNFGWAFITFRWPLIWVRNIEAGSIGTTAITRWDGDTMYLYLVRNGIAEYDPTNTTPALVTDVDSGLEINAKAPFATPNREYATFKDRPEVHIVRRSFARVTQGPSSGNLQTQSTTVDGVWTALEQTFMVSTTTAGDIVVTGAGVAGETEFLEQVLSAARVRSLYQLPLD